MFKLATCHGLSSEDSRRLIFREVCHALAHGWLCCFRVEKAIDEFHEPSSFSGSSDSSSGSNSSSSGGNTSDEYTSGVPGVPLEVLQEEFRTRTESGSRVGTSAPSSTAQDDEEIVYSCALDIPSRIDNKRLPVRGEWCCQPHFGVGIYEAYLLGGLRLPFNAFARELLTRLGLAICQFNPNAWRLIVSMQVLWREVFGGDRPLTVDEFLYCYKPSEINQSLGFHQFTARGADYRLIKSLVTSDRNWKTEFFFVSGPWAGKPSEVGRDPFGPYIGELRNLRPEGVRRPHLSKTFHFLVSLRRLAASGLGPEPSAEAIAHEHTVRRRIATMNQNKGKEVVDEVVGQGVQSQPRPSVGDKRKVLSKGIDLGKLPSRRREKRVKHGPSKIGVVQFGSVPPVQQTPVHGHDVDDKLFDPPSMHMPSTAQVPVSPQPSSQVPLKLLGDEDLAWERFERIVTDQDVAACYNMSLKDFEHFGVHDLFKSTPGSDGLTLPWRLPWIVCVGWQAAERLTLTVNHGRTFRNGHWRWFRGGVFGFAYVLRQVCKPRPGTVRSDPAWS
ncbi:hypothetical protein SO802_002350 [Lithocarpus litseifolius]|uniref:Transposase (putative) gypsy type domain-containing protein n=1 Tax=Lithocarpus litseifolius TaxID=425828 RepID=A0AAW2DXX4_9ROSI